MIDQSHFIDGARVRLSKDVNIIRHGIDQFAPIAGDLGTLKMLGLINGEDVWAVAFDDEPDCKFVACQLTSGEIVQMVDVCEAVPPTYPTDIDHAPNVIHPVGDEIERMSNADGEKFLEPVEFYFEDDDGYPEGLSEDEEELFDIELTLKDIEVEQKYLSGESFAMYQDRIAWLEKRADELKARREVLKAQILASGASSESEASE